MLPSPQLLNKVENFIQERGKFSYYCLFLLGKEAGLRISEAVKFDLSLKKSKNLYLIQGKRHKKRAVFVDPVIINELQKINWKPNKTNRFSYAHFLQRVKKELEISANIELTPHTLRRCFTTYQSLNGMPLPVLQQVLGHSSIRTTALYWKSTEDPKEKFFIDKWLAGKGNGLQGTKLPQEPPKAIEKTKELPKPPENSWKIFVNIQQKTNIFVLEKAKKSDHNLLEYKNKLLQAKIKQLEYEKKEQEQIINDLKNDKENLTKQLIQIQNGKNILLKMLSSDLKQQQQNLSLLDNKNQNIPELHQQLIAQIQVFTKS